MMKFTLPSETLRKAVARCKPFAVDRSTNPILAMVRLVAADGYVHLTATDTTLNWSESLDLLLAPSSPGAVCVPCAKFGEILGGCDGDVEVALDDGNIVILNGKARFELRTLPADEFPEVETGKADIRIAVVPALALRAMLETVIPAVSGDETREGLNGVLVEGEGADDLRLAATDGHRMHIVVGQVGGVAKFTPFLMSRASARTLAKLLADAPDHTLCTIDYRGSSFDVDIDGLGRFRGRTLNGTFPSYRQVIPKSWQRRMDVDAGELRTGVKRASTLAAEKSHGVKLALSIDSGVVLTSWAAEKGKARIPIDAVVEGADLEVGYNGLYLTDAVAALVPDGGRCWIEFGDSLSPTRIAPAEKTDTVAGVEIERMGIVMPMRLE